MDFIDLQFLFFAIYNRKANMANYMFWFWCRTNGINMKQIIKHAITYINDQLQCNVSFRQMAHIQMNSCQSNNKIQVGILPENF